MRETERESHGFYSGDKDHLYGQPFFGAVWCASGRDCPVGRIALEPVSIFEAAGFQDGGAVRFRGSTQRVWREDEGYQLGQVARRDGWQVW